MFCRAFGLCHRAIGAFVLLLLLVSGAEIAVRLSDLSVPGGRSRPISSSASPLIVPSWTAYQELRPLAQLSSKGRGDEPAEKIRINSFGLRGDEVVIPKSPNVVRVVCLGDESLLGLNLRQESLLTACLQERLQSTTRLTIEVWNAGVPGGCPLTEYLLLTHRLSALQPDLVVAAVDERDLAEDHAYRRFTRTDAGGTPLACRHPSLGRKPRANQLTAWRTQFRLVDLGLQWAGDTWKRKTEVEDGYDAESLLPDLARLRNDPAAVERMLHPFAGMARWCRGMNTGMCVLNVVPAAGDLPVEAEESAITSALRELAESEQFTVLNVERSSSAAGKLRDANWTAEEHQEFADRLADCVISELPGPWSSPYFRAGPPVSPASHQTPVDPQQRRAAPMWRGPSASMRRP